MLLPPPFDMWGLQNWVFVSRRGRGGVGTQSFMGPHRMLRTLRFLFLAEGAEGEGRRVFMGHTECADLHRIYITPIFINSAVVYTPNGGRKCNVRTL